MKSVHHTKEMFSSKSDWGETKRSVSKYNRITHPQRHHQVIIKSTQTQSQVSKLVYTLDRELDTTSLRASGLRENARQGSRLRILVESQTIPLQIEQSDHARHGLLICQSQRDLGGLTAGFLVVCIALQRNFLDTGRNHPAHQHVHVRRLCRS